MTVPEAETDEDFDYAPPGASAMLESLRGIGYSPAAAIADVIDNSIAAAASRVRIDFLWRGPNSIVRISDDGRGMDRAALIQAMRPAGRHPLEAREPEDLGRFGLGLKTASLSQGSLLAVASRVEGGEVETRYWDLAHVAAVDAWQLLRGVPEEIADDAQLLDDRPKGTVVVIARLDRMLGRELTDDATDRQRFHSLAQTVERHLSMTFHRYLEGPIPRLTITFNGDDDAQKVIPWDPFISYHKATAPTPVETISHSGGSIEVQGFVLPHRDRMSSAEFSKAEGPSGWQGHEGFFVYRGQRLLVPGGWLGLGPGRGWAQNGIHRLARIRLDLPTSGDQDWKVDIRKSSAIPPPSLRKRLQALAENVRRDAREIFAQRAGAGTRKQREQLVRAWEPVHTSRGVSYRVDRSHPSVRHALDAVGDKRRIVEEMLAVIEATVPVQRIWIDVSETADSTAPKTASTLSTDEAAALASLYQHMRTSLKLGADEARARLMMLEPFSAYPDAVGKLPEEVVG
ncbi:ATP-binding protein [Mesorhizobium sp. M1406]|uniref:ATP-binding protein n=1 Tax=Mesorhizobium sp. M1406 TaxID=2957099 RepID=UPI00333AC074